MDYFERNQYLNRLLENITAEETPEIAKKIPREIGEILVRKKSLEQGIVYLDWNMKFKHNLDVSRKGNYGRDEIQIIFSMNQDVEWNIEDNDQKIILKEGELCAYRNYDLTTSMCYSKERNFLFKSIQIPTDYFRNLLLHYFSKENVERMEELFLHQVTKTKITASMYRILYEMEQAEQFGEFKGLYLEGKVIELLSVVLHNLSLVEIIKIKHGCNLSPEDKKSIQQIKKCIDEHPEREYKGEKLAKQVNMSVSKLSRGFLQMYDMPIHKYVIEKRLEYAAMLLSEKSCNVSEAAGRCGYTNLSHFSNSFRKKYGVLPKDYAM